MLDAYTIRKAIPRLLIAVIGINLSIYLCVAAIDITNVIGGGIGQLLTAPFLKEDSYGAFKELEGNFENDTLGVLGLGSLGVLVGGIWAVGVGSSAVAILGLLFPLLVTIALISLAVLFTIVIRTGLLIFLSVISPIAIACFVLPGTEKYFKQWWDLFLKTLIIYPIIAILFAMSNVMGAILLSSAKGQPDGAGLVQIIGAILAIYAPLVLIPFAFKFAGGAIGTLMGAAGARAGGLAGRARQAIGKNRENPNSWLGYHAAKSRMRRSDLGLTPGQVMSGVVGGVRGRAGGRSFISGYKASSGTKGRTKAFDEASAFMENNEAFKAISGNDDSLWAFRSFKDETSIRNYLKGRGYDGTGLDQATAMVMRAQSQVSEQVGGIAAARMQAKTGTGYEDNAHMLNDISEASGGDINIGARMLAEMRGSAAQSGRIDLGTSSFNTQITSLAKLQSAHASKDGTIADPNYKGDGVAPRVKYTEADANREVMESVLDSNGAQQALYGKPLSAKHIGQAHASRIQDVADGIAAGKINPRTKQTYSQRDLDQALAGAMGLHDAMSHASPQNARQMSDALMNAKVRDPANPAQEISVYELGNDPTTVQNAGFAQMRKEYGNAARDEYERGTAGVNRGGEPPKPPLGQPPPPV